jgi:hypothetical protein
MKKKNSYLNKTFIFNSGHCFPFPSFFFFLNINKYITEFFSNKDNQLFYMRLAEKNIVNIFKTYFLRHLTQKKLIYKERIILFSEGS